MDALQILGWALGIGGVTGAIVMVLIAVTLGPMVAWAMVKTAIEVVKAVLSTRLGVAIVVGALCLFAGAFYGDHTGRAHEREKCEAAQARAEQGAIKRDREQTTAAAEDETALARELDTDQPKSQEIADAPATGADCPLADSDIRRRHPAKRVRAR